MELIMTQEDISQKFQDAMNFRKQGDYEAAYRLFLSLAPQCPESPGIHMMIGDMAQRLGLLGEEETHFGIASKLKPEKELPSVLYFHALRQNSKYREAILELKRFCLLGKPKEYIRLIEELREAAEESEGTRLFLEAIEAALSDNEIESNNVDNSE